MKKIIFISVFIGALALLIFAQDMKKYSAQEIKSDLDYMYENLELATYNLYAYVPKERMDGVYNEIYRSIKEPLTALEVFRRFQPFVASAKISHCFMEYPWKEYYGSYLQKGGTVFPMNLLFSRGRVLVKDNFSGEKSIGRFDEILSFNGNPIDQFMKRFYQYISGPTEYYKGSFIERNLFPLIYWFFYGECKEFKLRIRKKDGQEFDAKVQAIPGNEFEEKNKQQKSDKKPEREYSIISNRTAYLHPGDFININSKYDMMDSKTWDNTEFCRFIDSAFAHFREKKVKNLIIDLRNNSGGDNSFSDYMIAYMADEPFAISSRFIIKTSRMTKEFWKDINIPEHESVKKQILSRENGTCFDVDMPKTEPRIVDERFQGKVYVLINRYTYSNAASVAAIIQDYKFGTIIGEETAEEVASQAAFHVFKLPNTQWPVYYPKAFAIRPNGDPSPRGVVPDYTCYDDIFTEKDEFLDFTMKLIEER